MGLPKFKWHHLAESIAYQNRVAEEKMRNEIAQAKRENAEYLDNVDKAARMDKMRERKTAEGKALSPEEEAKLAKETMERRFKQKRAKGQAQVGDADDTLAKV